MTPSTDTSGHKTLLAALVAVQSECPTLPKDAINPHFKSKFTPLDTIVETVGPLLAKHGLTWSTFPTRDDHGPALRYVLGHAGTGDTLEDTMPLLLSKQDPQAQGSAITYARRYSICSVLNLVADEDEDGNAARRAKEPAAKAAAPPAPTPLKPESLVRVLKAIEEAGVSDDQWSAFRAGLGAAKDTDLTAAMAKQVRAWLDGMKAPA